MLTLFLYTYLSLPLDPATGARERVSPFYSLWPFISCIGSEKITIFQIVSFLIVACSILANSLAFWLNRDVHPGYWLRRIQLGVSLSGNGLLIWLVSAAEKAVETHLHITLVALRILCLFGTKTASFLTGRKMRAAYPALLRDKTSTTSFWWKVGLVALAIPLCVFAKVGAFTCREPENIQRRESVCWNMMAGAAVSDSVYTGANVVFLGNLSWDLCYDEHYGRVRRGVSMQRGEGGGYLRLEAGEGE